MKPLKLVWLRTLFMLATMTFSFALWAQDESGSSTSGSNSSTKTTSVHVSADNSGTWYTQPWVWVVGAAVFILLLVALLNGSRNRDTVERTTIRERNS